ncbi:MULTISPECIES: FAD/NAD(P)-binding protein [unclassified Acidovorax]|uniref:FAD/NAD(P)-binding protein n=1 Tax=unclassified Acidovorax TaxID=2684926 RepID=UPI001C461280|nr:MULTISPECIES: FAD/NAD(P)-binding protein [unclassified Acidovorax]MBV7459590.1 FAD/NAD(P)-binding protein [Acidovorax sp. sif0632]MBV7464615.1 FAD/NAD(P)-binding protein [Acidovorax sp. sif0613]
MKKLIIVGMGPRGLAMLERLLEHSGILPDTTHLHIDIVDPNPCGEGAHPAHQPEHLLVNTVASQITMFTAGSKVAVNGAPSLTEWCRANGYRRHDRQFLCLGDSIGAHITDADHLPRRLLGGYLGWFYDQVVSRFPANITLRHHRAVARDVEEVDGVFRVHLADGSQLSSDFLFLTTGHGRRIPTAGDVSAANFVAANQPRNSRLAFFASPYPVERLDSISADATVGIQGLGLTAHDVISALTTGRGGRYLEHEGELVYQPSGSEPGIKLFSRSCLPFAARGINQKGLTGKHQAAFFTAAAVKEIQERAARDTGDRRIDFERQVLPLVTKEMAYAYRCVVEKQCVDPATFVPSEAETQAINDILWPLRSRVFDNPDQFKQFFWSWLENDLEHARMGNLTSPIKAATDVLRDAREALRTAVEFAGLSPASHRFFNNEFNAIANRISFGPPLRRNIELFALAKSGILDVGGGPGARVVLNVDAAKFEIETPYETGVVRVPFDVLVSARLDSYSPLTDTSLLSSNLLRRGLVRPFLNGAYHPGGIDIDRLLRPLRRAGSVHERMWAAGFLVEGAHFYTHALPRPGMASRQAADAETCVLQLLKILVGSEADSSSDLPEAETA